MAIINKHCYLKSNNLFILLFSLLLCDLIFNNAFAEYNELLVGLEINGESQAGEYFVLRDHQGRIAMVVDDLQTLRIVLDSKKYFDNQETAFIWLDEVKHLQYQYNEETAYITLTLLSKYLQLSEIKQQSIQRNFLFNSLPSSYLNYDLSYSTHTTTSGGLFEWVVADSPKFGVFSQSFSIDNSTNSQAIRRLNTTYTKDLHKLRSRLIIGDAIGVNPEWTGGMRFGGASISSKNFNLRSQQADSVNIIGGVLEQDSTIDLYVNDVSVQREELPQGPYELNYHPSLDRLSQVDLKVTDALGREHFIRRSLYLSSKNLALGEQRYALQIGKFVNQYGNLTQSYGQAFMAANYLYGLTRNFHVDSFVGWRESGAENGTMLGIKSVLSSIYTGVLESGISRSSYGSATGYKGFINLQYVFSDARFSLQYETYKKSYREFNHTAEEQIDKVSRIVINAGTRLYGRTFLSCLVIKTEYRVRDRFGNYQCNLSIPIDRYHFTVSGRNSFDDSDQKSILFSLYFPLGGSYNVGTSFQQQSQNRKQTHLYFSKQQSASELGLGYSANLAYQQPTNQETIHLRADYKTSVTQFQYDYRKYLANKDHNIGMAGSFSFVENKWYLSRPIKDSAVLVKTNGLSDIAITRNNRYVGETSSKGLLIPNLAAYQLNRIGVDTKELPLEVSIDRKNIFVKPYYRSIAKAEFSLKKANSLFITLIDKNGKVLPSGSDFSIKGITENYFVVDDGQVFIENIPLGQYQIESNDGNSACFGELNIPDTLDFQQHLGEIHCL